MSTRKAVDSGQRATHSVGPFVVYSAGGLFSQHELVTNVLLKEAVWRLSDGRFQLYLPQSKEARGLDRPDIEAFIRNQDLLAVVKCDIILARFDGLELDSGTVVEFTMAKNLGKPSVTLRSDFRRLAGKDLGDPYNLMVKSWPRNVDVHIDTFMACAGFLAEEREVLGGGESAKALMEAELGAVQKSVGELGERIVEALEAALNTQSPYPPEYQEAVYRTLRYSPGSGFDQLLTEDVLSEIIHRLRKNGTL